MNLTQMQSKIFEHYGKKHQFKKGIEECKELIVEYEKFLNGEGDIDKLTDEIADNWNIQEQLLMNLHNGKHDAINKVHKVQTAKCERQLKRMENEMQDTQEMQVEIDNTAQQVESLAGSALTMSERDIESAIDGEWFNGDLCIVNNEGTDINVIDGCEQHMGEEAIIHYLFKNSKGYDMALVEFDNGGCFAFIIKMLQKPLTPEQKQAQIDEKNGELLWNFLSSFGESFCSWSSRSESVRSKFISAAKEMEFKTKIKA